MHDVGDADDLVDQQAGQLRVLVERPGRASFGCEEAG